MSNTKTKTSFQRAGLMACMLMLLAVFCAPPAQAQTRLIVRDQLGLGGINLTCLLTGCKVVGGLGDPQGQLFLVTFPPVLNPVLALLKLNLNLPGVLDVEVDQIVNAQQPTAESDPGYLTDEAPTQYYGATVWHGYLAQPANQLVRTAQTQSAFKVTGAGTTVAVIDTGVDVTNPILQPVLVNGYDFTRNVSGGSEMNDVQASPELSQASVATLNQRTVAVLDQRTVAVLDGGPYTDFGHGTMTAGIVHLVAPQAKIMPLKAFSANGTGYDSDILRAIYYAVGHGANVMNMSFDFTSYSTELATAVKYANSKGVISVASAGNDGLKTTVYPGGLPGVIDVASTSNTDVQSSFTNYGAPPVWLAAPGEGVVTTYPWGTYAAGWGTSFSTPFVAGTAALMLGKNGNCPAWAVPTGLANADYLGNQNLGYGRLDTYQALQVCQLF